MKLHQRQGDVSEFPKSWNEIWRSTRRAWVGRAREAPLQQRGIRTHAPPPPPPEGLRKQTSIARKKREVENQCARMKCSSRSCCGATRRCHRGNRRTTQEYGAVDLRSRPRRSPDPTRQGQTHTLAVNEHATRAERRQRFWLEIEVHTNKNKQSTNTPTHTII